VKFRFRLRLERVNDTAGAWTRNVREGRDPWHGIANHTPHVPRERLPQVGPYPAAPPLGWSVVVPPSTAFLSHSLPPVTAVTEERAA
jgi:hypothetical protein